RVEIFAAGTTTCSCDAGARSSVVRLGFVVHVIGVFGSNLPAVDVITTEHISDNTRAGVFVRTRVGHAAATTGLDVLPLIDVIRANAANLLICATVVPA